MLSLSGLRIRVVEPREGLRFLSDPLAKDPAGRLPRCRLLGLGVHRRRPPRGHVTSTRHPTRESPLARAGATAQLTWVWVKIKGIGVQVLVHVSIYRDSILGTYF